MQGNVEGRFLFSTVIACHVLPFALLEPWPVVLSVEESNGSYYTQGTQALKRKGYRDVAKWMEQAERIWIEKRGAKRSHILLQWPGYSGKLTAQSPRHRHLVLYNAAGTNVSATYCGRRALKLPLIVEHKLYWAVLQGAPEAHFVVAIMNSASANAAIKPLQSTGLLGERILKRSCWISPSRCLIPGKPRIANCRRYAHCGNANSPNLQ